MLGNAISWKDGKNERKLRRSCFGKQEKEKEAW